MIFTNHGNPKGKSHVTRYENSKPRTLLSPVTPHAANVVPITHYADNLGPSRATENLFATLLHWLCTWRMEFN